MSNFLALSQTEPPCHKAKYEVEYEAFIVGLRSASKLGVHELHIFSNSKLMVNQVIRKFEAQGPI